MYYDPYEINCRCLFDGDDRFMLITNRNERYTEYEQAEMFFEAGGHWVQLRMKDSLNLETANAVVRLTYKAILDRIVTINDNLYIAQKSLSWGVHLGKKDMPVAEARDLIHNGHPFQPCVIGATANTFEDIRQVVEDGADYIGLGPFRHTDTKKNLSPVLGLEGYRKIIARCIEEKIYIPIFAIGGIRVEDVGPLMETGINGIAISGAIINAADPAKETRRFLDEIKKY